MPFVRLEEYKRGVGFTLATCVKSICKVMRARDSLVKGLSEAT
jgi:hypothetical protein